MPYVPEAALHPHILYTTAAVQVRTGSCAAPVRHPTPALHGSGGIPVLRCFCSGGLRQPRRTLRRLHPLRHRFRCDWRLCCICTTTMNCNFPKPEVYFFVLFCAVHNYCGSIFKRTHVPSFMLGGCILTVCSCNPSSSPPHTPSTPSSPPSHPRPPPSQGFPQL